MGKTKIKTVDASQTEVPSKIEKKKVVEPTNKGKIKAVVVKGETSVVSSQTSDKDSKLNLKDKIVSKQVEKSETSKKKRGKKYQEAAEKVEASKRYPLTEAVSLAQESSYSSFKGSIEAHINTLVKNLRGNVSLPHSAGNNKTILGFGKGAKEAGADIIGSDETIAQIEKGKINFDIIVTTPEWMSKLAKVAKVLGPRGMMPNPKNDTVTENLTKAIADLRGGKTEYKTEKDGKVVHLVVGKVGQPSEEIAANIKTLYNNIGKTKIQKMTLSASMGPGVKVNLSSI